MGRKGTTQKRKASKFWLGFGLSEIKVSLYMKLCKFVRQGKKLTRYELK